jgi:hypothetical protein
MRISMSLDQGTNAKVEYLRLVRISRIHWTTKKVFDFVHVIGCVPKLRQLKWIGG